MTTNRDHAHRLRRRRQRRTIPGLRRPADLEHVGRIHSGAHGVGIASSASRMSADDQWLHTFDADGVTNLTTITGAPLPTSASRRMLVSKG